MNWVLILVLLVLIFSVLHGYQKGFLRIAYSMVSWIIVMAVVSGTTPYIHQFLLDNTAIYEKVEAHCEEVVRRNAEERTQEEISNQSGELAGLGVKLPDSVLEGILEKTSGIAGELLEESGVYTGLAGAMADFVMEGIAFVTALILARILVHLIAQILGIVSHIPILKGVNRFLGLFAGGVYGLFLVWLVFYVIALGSSSETGRVFVSYIYESSFLTFLYENNLVLTMFLKIF